MAVNGAAQWGSDGHHLMGMCSITPALLVAQQEPHRLDVCCWL
jgi:hypothetical protein